jgi:hypothetical protein
MNEVIAVQVPTVNGNPLRLKSKSKKEQSKPPPPPKKIFLGVYKMYSN